MLHLLSLINFQSYVNRSNQNMPEIRTHLRTTMGARDRILTNLYCNKNIPWKMKMFQIPEIGSLTWSEVSYEAILKSRTLIKLLKVIKAFQEDYRNLIIIVFIADNAALSKNTVSKKWCHFPWCRNCHYKLTVQLIFIANNVNELQLFLPTIMLPV